MKTSSFCVLPFLSVTCHQTGVYRLCCHDNGIKEEELLGRGENISIEEVRKSGLMKETRKKMLRGEKVKFCSSCDKAFGDEKKSRRESYNERYKKYIPSILAKSCIDSGDTNHEVVYMDIRLSNVCNLSCRMCFSESSSSRRDIDKLLGKKVFDINSSSWNIYDIYKHIEYVEELYFAGGEPLLDKNFIKFLNILVNEKKSKNIRLRINTNLTHIPTDFYKLAKKFKQVFFIISCDGYGDIYEYIRIGSKWNIFLNNLINLKRNLEKMGKGSTIGMVSVLQVDNVLDIHKLYTLCKKIDIGFNYNILEVPKNMNIGILPEQEKKNIYAYYNEKIRDNEDARQTFDMLIEYLKTSNPKNDMYNLYFKEKKIIDKFYHLETN